MIGRLLVTYFLLNICSCCLVFLFAVCILTVMKSVPCYDVYSIQFNSFQLNIL